MEPAPYQNVTDLQHWIYRTGYYLAIELKVEFLHFYFLFLNIPVSRGSVADSDPHTFAFILVGWIRIRIGNMDPDP